MLRPSENTLLFGHEALHTEFVRTLNQGRMPHGWLLVGPEGVGKETLAYQWIRLLLGKGHILQPQDPLFRRIAMETHGDFYVVRGRLVEDVRLLRQFLQKAPVESERRVAFLPRVDLWTHQAANALLKILEEPSDHTFFILTSQNLGALLPTIRSRCRMMRLSPMDFETFADGFQKLGATQGEKDPTIQRMLWELSGGCLGQALKLRTEGKVDDLIRLADIWTRGLLSQDDPDFSPPFHVCHSSFWSRFTVTELSDFIQSWVCHLMVEGARETLSSIRSRIYQSRDPDTWARINEKLNLFFQEAQTFHLDAMAVAVAGRHVVKEFL